MLWCRPFQQVTHENLRKTREALRKEILASLIKLVSTGNFPFRVGHWKDSEGFKEDGRIQRGLYSEGMKGFVETCTASSFR